MLLTPQTKETWLFDNLERAVNVESANDEYIATVKGLFNKRSLVSALEEGGGKVTLDKKVVLYRPRGVGTDRISSLVELHDKIRKEALENNLRLYWPKRGQDCADIQVGAAYRIIRQNDREHDHKDLRIFDFVRAAIDSSTGRIIAFPYKQKHIHYMLDSIEAPA